MKTISIVALKGGVGKTISAANMAHILATVHKKRVLLIDNDKQGNASKLFNAHSYNAPSVAELLTARDSGAIHRAVTHTRYATLDMIPANMSLLKANLEVLLDPSRPQQTRFRTALRQVESFYDFCIIDNAPDINISTINALVASNDVMIPIKIDKFAFDGLAELAEQIENTRAELNPALTFRGCFVTAFQRNEVNYEGEQWLRSQGTYPMFAAHIRRTEKVDESTFAGMPILEYSRYCNASRDYLALVEEYLQIVSETDAERSTHNE